jgi:uncharacterized protein (TIGR00297 family)
MVMVPSWSWLVLSFLFAGVVALAAYRLNLLSASGAIAAFLLGFLVFGFGGIPWAIVLFTFFISSSLLSKAFGRKKAGMDEKYAKGSRRDAGQVLANGGVAGLMVIFHILFPASIIPWVGFCAAFAGANADTWATELGVLSRTPPRLITTGKPVTMGSSGGVTLAGTLAATSGALLVAIAGAILCGLVQPGFLPGMWFLPVVTAAGLLGSLVDSMLGATLQAIYWCPECKKETEQSPLHRCGSSTSRIRGWHWLDNDWVNTVCTISAAGFGILLTLLASG